MRRIERACVALVTGLALVAAARAHGGAYRGLPTAKGGIFSPPRQPPASPTGTQGSLTQPRSILASPILDLSQWSVWWEFNKDPYLRLRDAVRAVGPVSGSDEFYLGAGRRATGRSTLAPSTADRRGVVLPALLRTLQGTRNKDIVTACLVAIAKLGLDLDRDRMLPVFVAELKRSDQEIRETAALALGLSRQTWAIDPLAALLADDAAGRRLVGTAEVDHRTRAFAAYGLGLIAHAADADGKRRVFELLRAALRPDRSGNRDVQVGVLQAMGSLGGGDSGKDKRLVWEATAALTEYVDADLGQNRQLIQAHALAAIARLLGRGVSADHERAKQRFAELLIDKKTSTELRQAAALALGEMATDGAADAEIATVLRRIARKASDPQTRSFALVALARIGGETNRELLIDTMRRGKGSDVAWAALGLGLLGHEELRVAASGSHPTDRIGDALLQRLGQASGPQERSAIAVGLGLCRYRPAVDELRLLLERYSGDEMLAGYLCIALALIGDDRAVEDIRRIVENAVRRPELLRQAAIALGRLGDKRAADLLVQLIGEGTSSVARLGSLSVAIGLIGDRRSIAPLVALMERESLSGLSRAFVAAALGSVCEVEKLPWNAQFAIATNYRAVVDSLTNGMTGILDIL